MNDNTEIILCAESLDFDSCNYKTFCSSPIFLTTLVAYPAPYSDDTVSPFLRVHCHGRETDRSPPFSYEFCECVDLNPHIL